MTFLNSAPVCQPFSGRVSTEQRFVTRDRCPKANCFAGYRQITLSYILLRLGNLAWRPL